MKSTKFILFVNPAIKEFKYLFKLKNIIKEIVCCSLNLNIEAISIFFMF